MEEQKRSSSNSVCSFDPNPGCAPVACAGVGGQPWDLRAASAAGGTPQAALIYITWV